MILLKCVKASRLGIMINWTFQRNSPLILSAVAGQPQHKEDTFNQTERAEFTADPLPEERPVSEPDSNRLPR
jgi:hypothetical protein